MARTFTGFSEDIFQKVLSNYQTLNLNFEKLAKKKRGHFLALTRTVILATCFSEDNKKSFLYFVYSDEAIVRTFKF